jgi:regulator of sigma E protease
MSTLFGALPTPVGYAVAFLLALFPLVLVHELAHFAIAKLNRVPVDEFGVGFPPRVWRIAKVAETEYTVNLLPIGGFVRLAGEDDPTVEGSFAGRSKRVRAAVLVAGPIANLLLAAAILIGLGLAGPVATPISGINGVTIRDVSPGSQAEKAGLQQWDIVVAADGQLLSQLAATTSTQSTPASPMTAEALTKALQATTSKSAGRDLRLTVLRGLQRVVPRQALTGIQTRPATLPGVTAKEVVAAPPESGLQAGDLLLTPATGAEGGSIEALGSDSSEPIVVRSLKAVDVTTKPMLATDTQTNQPVGRIGVNLTAPVVPVRLGILAAVKYGLALTVQLSQLLVVALVEMVRRVRPADVVGPLGISEMSRQAAQQGVKTFLSFVALLSINFGVINLLPIPALDGGRLLFVGAEAVRGRRVEPSREAIVHLIGLAMVLALMLVITYFDIVNRTGFRLPTP